MNLFLNKTPLHAGFSETEKKDAVPTILDPTVILQYTSVHNNIFSMSVASSVKDYLICTHFTENNEYKDDSATKIGTLIHH